jgi:hypothetical protein
MKPSDSSTGNQDDLKSTTKWMTPQGTTSRAPVGPAVRVEEKPPRPSTVRPVAGVSAEAPGPKNGAGALPPKLSGSFREDVCSLEEGAVVLHWPLSLSLESTEDLLEWLDYIKRKISKRMWPYTCDESPDHNEIEDCEVFLGSRESADEKADDSTEGQPEAGHVGRVNT